MNLLLYILNVAAARTESALGKHSGQHGGSVNSFNLAKTLAAAVLSAIISLALGFSFNLDVLLLAVLYGSALALSMHAGVKALSLGNMAIVSMLASFSLIIPCIFGLVFLEERLSPPGIAGIALLCLALLLLGIGRGGGGRLSGICWLYSILTLIGNGISSVIQKLQQTRYPGEYRIEFMLISGTFAFLIFLVLSSITKPRSKVKLKLDPTAKLSEGNGNADKTGASTFVMFPFTLGGLAGICNCIANYSILFLASSENASVMFPIISAGNTIGAWLVSRLVFKEKLTAVQLISVTLGALSVILLKI